MLLVASVLADAGAVVVEAVVAEAVAVEGIAFAIGTELLLSVNWVAFAMAAW